MNDLLPENFEKRSKRDSFLFTNCLAIYYLSLPLGALNITSQGGSLLKYIALLPIAAFLISKKSKIRISKISNIQFLYTIFILLSVSYSISPLVTLQKAETNIMFFILLLLTGSVLFEQTKINKLKNSLVWSSRITLALMLFYGNLFEGRLVLKGIINEDPNYINGYLLFGLASAVQILLADERLKKRVLAGIELSLYLYASLATGSRGGFFSILAVILIIFLFEKQRNNILFVTKRISFIIMISIVILIVINYIPSNILERFNIGAIASSNGTGRYTIWENAIFIFKSSSIFREVLGFGPGTMGNILGNHGFNMQVGHNIFIDHLLEGGILLLVIYFWLIISCLLNAIKNRDIFTVAILIGFIVLSMSASIHSFKPYWNIIIFSNLIIKKRQAHNSV